MIDRTRKHPRFIKVRTLALFGLLAGALLLSGCISLGLEPAKRRTEDMVLETLIKPDSFFTTNKVLLAPIDGYIDAGPYRGRPFEEPSTVVQIKDILKRAKENDSIKAVLLRINSPGGSVTASDLLYTELKRFKEETGKKVVAVFLDVGASGAYYTAMAADKIYAHPTTVTGSIGVIAMYPEVSELTGKIGFDMRIIKAGEMKDMGSIWRKFKPEEREVLQETIDSMYNRFLDVVQEGRPNLSKEKIKELANGRIYPADEALKLGLIDGIGYIEDVFESTKELAGIDDASLVIYKKPFSYVGHYYASADAGPASESSDWRWKPSNSSQVNLFNIDVGSIIPSDPGPFHYLWMP